MKTEAITLMEAYIIENLRKQGVSNDELIQVDNQLMERWKLMDDRFDYKILEDLAKQNSDQFSAIINHGYTVKFLTLNGLVNLVQLKLDQKRDEDFTVHKDGITRLVVNKDEQQLIEQMLSPNWKVLDEEAGLSIRSRND